MIGQQFIATIVTLFALLTLKLKFRFCVTTFKLITFFAFPKLMHKKTILARVSSPRLPYRLSCDINVGFFIRAQRGSLMSAIGVKNVPCGFFGQCFLMAQDSFTIDVFKNWGPMGELAPHFTTSFSI